MWNKDIKKNLSLLGIDTKKQLDKNDIFFWWQKKFLEIQKNNLEKERVSELLIEINNAKEYLEKIDLEILKAQFTKSHVNQSSTLDKSLLEKQQKSISNSKLSIENKTQKSKNIENKSIFSQKYIFDFIGKFIAYGLISFFPLLILIGRNLTLFEYSYDLVKTSNTKLTSSIKFLRIFFNKRLEWPTSNKW